MEFETIKENGKEFLLMSELKIENTNYYLFGNEKVYTKNENGEYIEYKKYTENDQEDEINKALRDIWNPESTDIQM